MRALYMSDFLFKEPAIVIACDHQRPGIFEHCAARVQIASTIGQITRTEYAIDLFVLQQSERHVKAAVFGVYVADDSYAFHMRYGQLCYCYKSRLWQLR
jgi:hypothetical protein